MGRRERKTEKKRNACLLCGNDDDDEILYGKFHHIDDFSIHQNCMFLSSGLAQRGSHESEGILGFLIKDIKEEYARGQRLRCCYCKKEGATIGCVVNNCKRSFHYPCGIKNHALSQHFNDFSSYCHSHKLRQKHIQIKEELYCYICCNTLTEEDLQDSLYPPCCKNNWFHHYCLQKYAINAGLHFFKCPLCNNSSEFLKEMKIYGICIPDKDASWELESNAFSELLYRPECGALECLCRLGRKYDGKSGWCLLTCSLCGADARHKKCGNIDKSDKIWKCDDCKAFEAAKNEQLKVNHPNVLNKDNLIAAVVGDSNEINVGDSNEINVGDSDEISVGDDASSLKENSICQVAASSLENDSDEVTATNHKDLLQFKYKLRAFSIILNKVAIDVKPADLKDKDLKRVNKKCGSVKHKYGDSESKASKCSLNKACALGEKAISSSEAILNNKALDEFVSEGDNIPFTGGNDIFEKSSTLEKNSSLLFSEPMKDIGVLANNLFPLSSALIHGVKAAENHNDLNKNSTISTSAISKVNQKKNKCLKDRNMMEDDSSDFQSPVMKNNLKRPKNSKLVKPKRRRAIGNGCCSENSNRCIKKMFGITCENCG